MGKCVFTHLSIPILKGLHQVCLSSRTYIISVASLKRRRRRTQQEKIAIIQQTMELSMTLSHVTRLHGINANQIFKWSCQYEDGSLTAVASGEEVVHASELVAANKQIREQQRFLGKKTMEAQILQEPLEFGQANKWIAHAPLLPGDYE